MGGAEADLVGELRRLAGVGDVDGFVVEAAPHPFEVRYFSGSASHLRFVARYDAVARADHDAAARPAGAGSYRRSGRGGLVAVRPLAITLRRERSDDVEAKRKGVNVEHQTGDDDFDRNVYVSTPTADPEVLSAVLGPKLRSGVLALLDLGFQYVAIDDRDGDVEAYLSAFVERNPRPGRGEKAVAAFALVLSDLPAITASGGAHPRPPFWARGVTLGVVWIASGVLGPFASCYVADATECTASTRSTDGDTSTSFRDGCGSLALVALAASVVVAAGAAALARRLATPRLRGHAESARGISYATVATFVLTLVVAYCAASGLAFSLLHR